MITIETGPYKKIKAGAPQAPDPPFCPHPQCQHFSDKPQGKWFLCQGSRKNHRHGVVWFYLCSRCQRSFSSSSFLISYYEKVDLDYDKICSYARSDISLAEWARRMNTTPGTLKLRLCKIGRLLIKELSDLCVWAAGELFAGVHQVMQRGGGPYRVLRELVVSALALLHALRPASKPLLRNRPFTASFQNEKKNLFGDLWALGCGWRFRVAKGVFYYTVYQWE